MSHPSSEDWKELCGCVLFWGGLDNTDKTAKFRNILPAATLHHLRKCFSISATQYFKVKCVYAPRLTLAGKE
jgi:hypothetical protein